MRVFTSTTVMSLTTVVSLSTDDEINVDCRSKQSFLIAADDEDEEAVVEGLLDLVVTGLLVLFVAGFVAVVGLVVAVFVVALTGGLEAVVAATVRLVVRLGAEATIAEAIVVVVVVVACLRRLYGTIGVFAEHILPVVVLLLPVDDDSLFLSVLITRLLLYTITH